MIRRAATMASPRHSRYPIPHIDKHNPYFIQHIDNLESFY
jgi:hypothetical protein